VDDDVRGDESMIYLASPYSHPDPAVRQERFEAACRAAAALMRRGRQVFCPIAHSHSIVGRGGPEDVKTWMKLDLKILRVCSELVVLLIPGYFDSCGVAHERSEAWRLKMPVWYVTLEELETSGE